MNKTSKRDINIARASLLVYPPSDAYLEYQTGKTKWYLCNDTAWVEVRPGRGQMSFYGVWPHGSGTCESTPRRIKVSSSQASWMNNFAQTALEAWHHGSEQQAQLSLRNYLSETALCFHRSWARACSELIAKIRTEGDINNVGWFDIGDDGIIRHPHFNFLSKSQATKVLRLAKSFSPTDSQTHTTDCWMCPNGGHMFCQYSERR